MNSKIALTATLWLAIGGTVVATALPDAPITKYPSFPEYPIDDTEARLQHLEMLVTKQQLVIQNLRNDLANMVAINDYVTLETVHGRPTVRFNAVNVQVVNGLGYTTASNGLGNILVGYDQLRNGEWGVYAQECSRGTGAGNAFQEPVSTQAECLAAGGTWGYNHKGGSHYLVVGDEHNYSSWAGIVTGAGNTSNSEYASVTGGLYNQATGVGAAISGGARGRASGYLSSVSGGSQNVASGQSSSVTGGLHSIASGAEASVTGGSWNQASAHASTVSGGIGNAATGTGSAISGGSVGTASGQSSSISGGNAREMQYDYGWAGGVL